MRYLRMIFVVLLAIALVTVSLANRQIVEVGLLPGQMAAYVGHSWTARMPLFLVIILALLVGMVLGLIWEWLREAHLRQESSRRAVALTRLESEVGGLRAAHAAPRDEVLAILDAPSPAPGGRVAIRETRVTTPTLR